MARNTTRQGAGFELDVMHYLVGCKCELTHSVPKHVGWKGFGYDAGRSSGSRGKVDVWGVPPESGAGPMVFIQCKITNPIIPPADRVALINLARRGGGLPLVAYKARDNTTSRIRPHFRYLTGTRPQDWVLWEPGEDN